MNYQLWPLLSQQPHRRTVGESVRALASRAELIEAVHRAEASMMFVLLLGLCNRRRCLIGRVEALGLVNGPLHCLSSGKMRRWPCRVIPAQQKQK